MKSLRGKKKIELSKERDDQFFVWKRYRSAKWKKNEKTPLLIFGSSWHDPKFDIERFCGVSVLEHGTPDTKELLQLSPHYIQISYRISEQKQ